MKDQQKRNWCAGLRLSCRRLPKNRQSLNNPPEKAQSLDEEALHTNSKILEKKLKDYGVDGQVIAVTPGPVVTMYEFEPAAGVKVASIVNLSDDLALPMRATSIR